MNSHPVLPSWLQYAAKVALIGVALVLSDLHELTPQLSNVLGYALIAMGVTNGATLIAQAAGLGAAAPPPPSVPSKPAAVASSVVATGAALAMAIVFCVMLAGSLACAACGSATPSPQEEALAQKGVDELCALNAARLARQDAGAIDAPKE
jgi:hypothetical protein